MEVHNKTKLSARFVLDETAVTADDHDTYGPETFDNSITTLANRGSADELHRVVRPN